MKSRISPKSAKPSASWSRRLSRPAKPAKPTVLELGSESNTNSESFKSTVFRIGANQTHPLSFVDDPLRIQNSKIFAFRT